MPACTEVPSGNAPPIRKLVAQSFCGLGFSLGVTLQVEVHLHGMHEVDTVLLDGTVEDTRVLVHQVHLDRDLGDGSNSFR